MMSENRFDQEAKDWDQRPSINQIAEAFTRELRATVPLTNETDVLDFGCGTGIVSMGLQPDVRSMHLVDTSEGMLGVVQEKMERVGATNMTLHCDDIANIGLADASVDLLITAMALHHVPDTAAMLALFRRLLRPGGHLCIGDLEPEDGSFHSDKDMEVHHGFAADALSAQMESAGFGEVDIRRMLTLTKPDAEDVPRDYPIFFAHAVAR